MNSPAFQVKIEHLQQLIVFPFDIIFNENQEFFIQANKLNLTFNSRGDSIDDTFVHDSLQPGVLRYLRWSRHASK